MFRACFRGSDRSVCMWIFTASCCVCGRSCDWPPTTRGIWSETRNMHKAPILPCSAQGCSVSSCYYCFSRSYISIWPIRGAHKLILSAKFGRSTGWASALPNHFNPTPIPTDAHGPGSTFFSPAGPRFHLLAPVTIAVTRQHSYCNIGAAPSSGLWLKSSNDPCRHRNVTGIQAVGETVLIGNHISHYCYYWNRQIQAINEQQPGKWNGVEVAHWLITSSKTSST